MRKLISKNFFLIIFFFIGVVSLNCQTRYRIHYGSPLARQLRDLFDAQSRAADSRSEISQNIAKAREDYFDALKNGNPTEQKAKVFFTYLFVKDILIHQTFSFGENTPNRSGGVLIDKMIGTIDGGIDLGCLDAYSLWSGVYSKNIKDLLGSGKYSPQEVSILAFEKSQEYYERYTLFRDWVEHERQGVIDDDISSLKQFADVLIKTFSRKESERGATEIYQDAVAVFGEDYVLSKYKILKNGKMCTNDDWDYSNLSLNKLKTVGLDYYSSSMGGTAFYIVQELIGRGSPKNYIMGRLYKSGYCDESWQCAKVQYNRLEMAFGKTKVNALSEKIYTMPRRSSKYNTNLYTDYVIDRVPIDNCDFSHFVPYNVFYVLLTKDDSVGFFRYLIANHFELDDLEKLNKKVNELFEKYGKENLLKYSSEVREFTFNDCQFYTRGEANPYHSGPYKDFEYIVKKFESKKGIVVENLNFESIGFNELTVLGGRVKCYFDKEHGCVDTAKVYVRIISKEDYSKSDINWTEYINEQNKKIFDWNSVCKGQNVKVVEYLFYDEFNSEIIRKSWISKDENWNILHTDIEYSKENGIYQSDKKETLNK